MQPVPAALSDAQLLTWRVLEAAHHLQAYASGILSVADRAVRVEAQGAAVPVRPADPPSGGAPQPMEASSGSSKTRRRRDARKRAKARAVAAAAAPSHPAGQSRDAPTSAVVSAGEQHHAEPSSLPSPKRLRSEASSFSFAAALSGVARSAPGKGDLPTAAEQVLQPVVPLVGVRGTELVEMDDSDPDYEPPEDWEDDYDLPYGYGHSWPFDYDGDDTVD